MIELNNIYNCDCRDGLKQLDANSVDLTVTSPPYDSLRTYQDDEFAWNFDIFKEVADELYRVTKPGGVVVWVVGDEVVKGGETGTSFRQALYFQEIGFKIHDTMVYEKNSSTFPAKINSKRYSQIFEYMFVFVKGKIRDDIKLIADKRNKWAGWTNWGTKTQYDKEGNLVSGKKNIKPTPEFSLRTNIWKYNVSFNDKTGHPAVFPEKLAEDHILSWTVEGDTVLDPFMGSGTTAKMARLNRRNFIGFEKNEDYWKVSLERLKKYDGKENEAPEEMEVNTTDGESGTLIISSDNDKEENEKIAIVNSIIEQLNEYANDMSASILKTLKLTFVSKSNDKRVEKVLKERGLYSGDTEEKIDYEQPKVNEVVEIPESDMTSDLTCPIEPIPLKEYVAPSCTVQDSRDTDPDYFIKNCEKILPNGPVMKAENITANQDRPQDTVVEPENPLEKEYENRGVADIDFSKFIPGIFATKEFEQAIRNEMLRILRNDDELREIIKREPNKPEEKDVIVVNEPPIDDSVTVIDLKTMDPVPINETRILPDELTKAIESGDADKIVEVQPMKNPDTFEFPPKKKRGRPKGSKNKPKIVVPQESTENVLTENSDGEQERRTYQED